IGAMLGAVRGAIDSDAFRNTTLHLHDTSGQAAACAIVALDVGIRSFDASASGLGGCPYASTPERRAPGNIATGVLLKALKAAGCASRIDEAKLADAEGYARSMVGGCEPAA
ncbi:MAG: hydroxymethylglutaryl-CoA lyase, partial [Planctomycetes bacterium]|nr:hydroxymethylglutaryl-CoA lyase [Planctomycetota bacterium]